MPELNPDEFEDLDDYACAVQAAAIADADNEMAIGGDEHHTATQYAIEPDRGWNSRAHTDELYGAIEALPEYRPGARIITREITYGPWRYVTPDELGGQQ